MDWDVATAIAGALSAGAAGWAAWQASRAATAAAELVELERTREEIADLDRRSSRGLIAGYKQYSGGSADGLHLRIYNIGPGLVTLRAAQVMVEVDHEVVGDQAVRRFDLPTDLERGDSVRIDIGFIGYHLVVAVEWSDARGAHTSTLPVHPELDIAQILR